MGTVLNCFGGLVVLLAAGVYYALFYKSFTLQTPRDLNPQYDYIIVGGGSAGSVLAARLSEDPHVSVLVLEAGPDHYSMPLSHIPAMGLLMQNTHLDWQYKTVVQKHSCLGIRDQVSVWHAGKMLGGSSVINGMIAMRGTESDFNSWQSGEDDSTWNFAEGMLPYYKKVENFASASQDDVRGTTGPVVIQEVDKNYVGQLVLDAFKELGSDISPDYNGGHRKSNGKPVFGWTQQMVDGRRRVSAASAYLEPALGRTNFHVVTNATVSKITFNEERKAVGVEYYHNGKINRVLTNREIILSAGAVETPKLLMLSGIGPRAHLQSLGIPLVHDLPAVGQNLADHILVDIGFGFNQSFGDSLQDLLSPLGIFKAGWNFLMGTGPLITVPLKVVGFLERSENNGLGPNLQLLVNTQAQYHPGLFSTWNFTDETFDSTWANGASFPSACHIFVALVRPHSCGTVTLASKNPFDPPLIDPQYLSQPADVNSLREGLKFVLKLLETDVFRKSGAKVMDVPLPGCKSHEWLSEAYLDCFIRHKTMTYFHPTGSCRMGKKEEARVVDECLRVDGISGLRVVDASVFSQPLASNPVLTVLAIAEKAADIIKSGV